MRKTWRCYFFGRRFGKQAGCPTKRAQMKGEVKSAKKIECLWMEGSEKATTPNITFKKLLKSVDKGCIILLSDEPAKPLRGSPKPELLIWDVALLF